MGCTASVGPDEPRYLVTTTPTTAPTASAIATAATMRAREVRLAGVGCSIGGTFEFFSVLSVSRCLVVFIAHPLSAAWPPTDNPPRPRSTTATASHRSPHPRALRCSMTTLLGLWLS